MNKEQYVTFEVAKYLKENGFDWFTFYSYEVYNGSVQLRVTNGVDTGFPLFPRPTQQKAMRWLRNEKGIHIFLIPVKGLNYVVSVYVEQGNKTYDRILSRSGRNAYEDAVDAALLYVFQNLI